MWCLMSENDPITEKEAAELKENLSRVVHEGLKPNLNLLDNGQEVPLSSRIAYQIGCLKDLAVVIDQVKGTTCYAAAIETAEHRVAHPETIASNRLRELMKDGKDHTTVMLELAEQHQKYFSALTEDADLQAQLEKLSERSIDQQAAIESVTQLSFQKFLDAYQHQDDNFCQ